MNPKIEVGTNHGQVADTINNYRDLFHKMTLEELNSEHQQLIFRKKMTKSAFIKHPTVRPFYISGIAFLTAIIWLPVIDHQVLLTALQVLSSMSLLGFWYLMETQRKSLFNAINYTNEDIKRIEAAIAVKELEAKRDKTKS